MQNNFKKEERLKSKKQIDLLFANGDSLFCYPIRLVYSNEKNDTESKIKALFSVSKKNLKKAVHRNKIKRQMREAYRKNKYKIMGDQKLCLAFIYIEKSLLSYTQIESAITNLIKKLAKSDR